MRLLALKIMFMAFITITEEGKVDENTLGSRHGTVLHGRISGESRKDMPASESVQDNSVDILDENIIENQGKLLFSNNNMDFENKKKYVFHHRGNRKYLADNYGEENSDFSDNNLDGEEADVYSKVDESSEEYLDSSILSSVINEEANEYYTKDSEKSINNEKEKMKTDIYYGNHQQETFENYSSVHNDNVYKEIPDANNPTEHTSNHDYMKESGNQSLKNEEKSDGIIEESDEFQNDIDEDESFISPDVESFWDAVDTFIKMNPYSENLEDEDSEDPGDLYDYLYTPSGNSPGIDHFLDLLHFVKDVGDAVERIEKDVKWTSEKDPEISPLDISNNHEVDEMMANKEDNHMSLEGYKINKNADKINRSSSNRSKRSNTKESDTEIKTYQHKPFGSGLGLKFPLFKFDLFFSKLIFEPFAEPYPVGE